MLWRYFIYHIQLYLTWDLNLTNIVADKLVCHLSFLCFFSLKLPSLNLFPPLYPFFLSSEVECCGTLWPYVSWHCPWHRTVRSKISKSSRTLTKPGWVDNIKRSIEFYLIVLAIVQVLWLVIDLLCFKVIWIKWLDLICIFFLNV